MNHKDLNKVHALEVECQQYPWPRWIFRRQLRTGASCWVFEQNEEIIGFGIVRIIGRLAHLMNIGIAPSARRSGLGRRMMQQLLNIAKHNRAHYAWLEVRRTNRKAIVLYQNLGFRQRQTRPNYYLSRRGREDAIVMIARVTNTSLSTPFP